MDNKEIGDLLKLDTQLWERICPAEQNGLIKQQVLQLRAENILLAKLASDKPEFYNPFDIVQAKKIRDRILKGGDKDEKI